MTLCVSGGGQPLASVETEEVIYSRFQTDIFCLNRLGKEQNCALLRCRKPCSLLALRHRFSDRVYRV